MEKKVDKKNGLLERNYDKEIKNIFDDALKEMDSDLMETIKIISKMNEAESNKFEVSTFSNGTVNREPSYAG